MVKSRISTFFDQTPYMEFKVEIILRFVEFCFANSESANPTLEYILYIYCANTNNVEKCLINQNTLKFKMISSSILYLSK